MIIKIDSKTCIVFDLDDTLYSEIDYLISAYKYIAYQVNPMLSDQLFEKIFSIYKSGGNAFEYIMRTFRLKNYTKEYLLKLYRNHYPDIKLEDGVLNVLLKIKEKGGKVGIITNGRSVTQRNKIRALGLDKISEITIISEEIGYEKPDEMIYSDFQRNESLSQLYFIGDNPKIDFITPKRLGWCCIGILSDHTIHNYNIEEISQEYLPHLFIKKIFEIEII